MNERINYYRQKYIKYKNKYISSKNNQIGGYFNKSEWNEIPNSGQQNCGIYISDRYPDKIVKCEDGLQDNKIGIELQEINKNFFPQIYGTDHVKKNIYYNGEVRW